MPGRMLCTYWICCLSRIGSTPLNILSAWLRRSISLAAMTWSFDGLSCAWAERAGSTSSASAINLVMSPTSVSLVALPYQIFRPEKRRGSEEQITGCDIGVSGGVAFRAS